MALLFDDVPDALNAKDGAVFASLADAQVHVANAVCRHLSPSGGFRYFCRTEYCAASTGQAAAASPYLSRLGGGLDAATKVCWTSRDIVSKTIDLDGVLEVRRAMRRRPFIWDNFHANGYDLRRVRSGPLARRDPATLAHVSGRITNLDTEFEANFVLVATTRAFLTEPTDDPQAALHSAVTLWAPRFARNDKGQGRSLPCVPKPLINWLVAPCYLPFFSGPAIEVWVHTLEQALARPGPDPASPAGQAAVAGPKDLQAAINDLFDRMTDLNNRELFHTFHPYLWEARAELQRLVTYLDWLATNPPPDAAFPQESLVYNSYRRGFTAGLNDLVRRDRCGAVGHGR